MADINPLISDLGITPPSTEDNPLISDLGITRKADTQDPGVASKEPDSWGGAIKGELDAGAVLASGALAGTAGSVLRTANRMIPDWGGTKEELKSKIDSWQNAFTHEPSTPEGQYVMDQLGKVVHPVTKVLSKATGAVVGTENVPAVADAVGAIPGFDIAASVPASIVRGGIRGGAAGAEAMEQSANAAEAAGLKTSVGQTSGNPIVRAYENIASRLPGGKPLAEARDVNGQTAASVSNIIKKINPKYDESPATPRDAGVEIEEGANRSIARGKKETGEAADAMNEAVGGADTPMSAEKTHKALASITQATGIPEVDEALTAAKTRKAANVISAVSDKPKIATSYTSDGEGAHVVKSPNGETHFVEQANGDLKAWRSDTKEFDEHGNELRGKGESQARLATGAHIAASKGGNLVSDATVSHAEAGAFDALGRKGWTVEKNPNAEKTEHSWVSDSPKNPVYTVKAPATEVTPGAGAPKQSAETHFGGEWTYNPETGKSEPVTEPAKVGGPTDQIKAKLNPDTPWTFKAFRDLRTNVGRAIKGTRDLGQRTQLQRLYGVMSDDLKDFVKTKGADAEQKYEFFNSVAKQSAVQRVALEKAIKNEGGAGEVFTKAMRGSSDDAGRISRVMGAMDEEGKNTFRSVVLHRMGRVGGAQTGPFNADTFLKNWDKMSVEGKNVLFSGGNWQTAGLRKSLDSLTNALTDMKASGQLKSTLGKEMGAVGKSVSHGVGLLGALYTLREFGHPMLQLMEGHPFAAAGTVATAAAALVVNPVMSHVLTNPKLVSWLAQSTKMPKSGLPAMMVQLHQMGQKDKDAKDLESLIEGLGTATASEPKKEITPPQGTIYPKINRSAGMQPLPGGGSGIPPETM